MYQPRPRVASHINVFSGPQALHTPHGPAPAANPAAVTASRTYPVSWPLQEVPKVNILCPLGARDVELNAEYRVLWRRFHGIPSAPYTTRTGHTRGSGGRDRYTDLDRFIYPRQSAHTAIKKVFSKGNCHFQVPRPQKFACGARNGPLPLASGSR
jgi:hypothetical protein